MPVSYTHLDVYKRQVRAYGSVSGNKLKADGSMHGSDGATVREKCTFLLANDEMTFAPAVEKTSKAPVAKVVKSVPAPTSTTNVVTTAAVSYTHLDVYKRQIFYIAN